MLPSGCLSSAENIHFRFLFTLILRQAIKAGNFNFNKKIIREICLAKLEKIIFKGYESGSSHFSGSAVLGWFLGLHVQGLSVYFFENQKVFFYFYQYQNLIICTFTNRKITILCFAHVTHLIYSWQIEIQTSPKSHYNP